MNWTAISSIAAVIAALAAILSVFVAFYAFRTQNRIFGLSISADLVTKQEERFNGESVKMMRVAAARSLLGGDGDESVEGVADFFETIGLLTRLKALNVEMVHSTFFHWINGYWRASHRYIEQKRVAAGVEQMWEDFDVLQERVSEIERANEPNSKALFWAEDDIRVFLEEELSLSESQ